MNQVTKAPIPRKLNDGMIGALSEYIRKGNYPIVACELAGIDWHTLARWQTLGAEELARDDPDRENVYLRLFTAIKKAEAEAEALMVETARNAAIEKKDGYLAITVNERRHPDRWGRKDRTKVDITEKKSIVITHVEVLLDQSIEGEYKEIDNAIQITRGQEEARQGRQTEEERDDN